ncbi:MAG: hypothetical protein JXA74_08775 [Anaerolineae bacterium]|nr:hypothetical protein [Anaerolineae bacterium]
MEDQLDKLRPIIRRGTLKQFTTEASAKIAPHGYTGEFDGEALTFYRVAQEKAGLFKAGKRQVKTPVLKVSRPGAVVVFDPEVVDPEFVELLLRLYRL